MKYISVIFFKKSFYLKKVVANKELNGTTEVVETLSRQTGKLIYSLVRVSNHALVNYSNSNSNFQGFFLNKNQKS